MKLNNLPKLHFTEFVGAHDGFTRGRWHRFTLNRRRLLAHQSDYDLAASAFPHKLLAQKRINYRGWIFPFKTRFFTAIKRV
jgi:hypothetical protein